MHVEVFFKFYYHYYYTYGQLSIVFFANLEKIQTWRHAFILEVSINDPLNLCLLITQFKKSKFKKVDKIN